MRYCARENPVLWTSGPTPARRNRINSKAIGHTANRKIVPILQPGGAVSGRQNWKAVRLVPVATDFRMSFPTASNERRTIKGQPCTSQTGRPHCSQAAASGNGMAAVSDIRERARDVVVDK